MTDEITCTGLVGFAELELDETGADEACDAAPDSDVLGARVRVTVVWPVGSPDEQAVATRAADARAPSSTADRRARRSLTRPP
jgi:hypothetical protein